MKRSLIALAIVLSTAAQAAAPQLKTQAPGVFRMMLGDFEITALSDGTLDLPVDKLLKEKHPGQVAKALKQHHLGLPTETSVNAYLINTGAKLVMVDSGASGLFGPTLGRLLANLKAAGYQPEQVDEIYITHLHGDHVGGLLADGKAAFPNAVVRLDKRDADFWLSTEQMNKAPASARDFFLGAQMSTKPYVDGGRLKPFEGATELVPGVRAQPAYGHTPGHTVYVAESKGQKMLFGGDLMHVASVQFEDPTVTIAFDSDDKQAMPARKKVYAEAAAGGYWLAFTHVSFPGIGHVRAQGKGGYSWLPVNYTRLP
ncbi:MBL fold metallo-hydrolase [Pelomonas sp. SE-A7]|uniref:MBL fold metallo-hydrolase n=1 Tax=Pelomonas sp. SE-A7 TaxID=3054953 RepID=UPI00259D0040|nr:MBL fold metallo-hydrolase [Pelomonas sp. SE-A7]MDM4768421.1 MBL fold metallo-hydrolase [Pelomonas sp. SE-A7]